MVGVRGFEIKANARPVPARMTTTTTPMMAHMRQAGGFFCSLGGVIGVGCSPGPVIGVGCGPGPVIGVGCNPGPVIGVGPMTPVSLLATVGAV